MNSIRLILASQSPRRQELLEAMQLSHPYEIVSSEFEEQLDSTRFPEEVSEELGYGKALWVAERNPKAWVIGSDTIVTINGQQLGKPQDEKEARAMLQMLAGQPNTVTTSAVLLSFDPTLPDPIRCYKGSESCQIYFKPYDQAAVDTYIASGDWHDKAGAYGLQSGAHILVDRLQGDFDTIVGLPTKLLSQYLAQIGVTSQPVYLAPPVPSVDS